MYFVFGRFYCLFFYDKLLNVNKLHLKTTNIKQIFNVCGNCAIKTPYFAVIFEHVNFVPTVLFVSYCSRSFCLQSGVNPMSTLGLFCVHLTHAPKLKQPAEACGREFLFEKSTWLRTCMLWHMQNKVCQSSWDILY